MQRKTVRVSKMKWKYGGVFNKRIPMAELWTGVAVKTKRALLLRNKVLRTRFCFKMCKVLLPKSEECCCCLQYNTQSWALAHFFKVRYPLPTQFFPLDRWRSCVHFFNFPFRSLLKRSSLNQWFAERKRAKSLIAHRSKHGIFFSPLFYNQLACQDSIPSLD